MITSIIFSKNRPLQLDLCLSSIKKNFPDSSHNIVIHNNSREFEEAHKTLETEHPNIAFRSQGFSLFQDIYKAICSSKHEYVCFFTDDNICFSGVPSIPYQAVFAESYVTCISLRLGLNICQRSHEGNIFPDRICDHHTTKDLISWLRTSHLYGSYWSYSLSVDGHIFRKNDILDMIDELCYLEQRYKWNQTPNELESALQRFWTITPNVMVAPKTSVVVNSPNNRVQNTCDNMSGEIHNYEADFLLDKYVAGARINLDRLDFSNIKSPHTEIDIITGLS